MKFLKSKEPADIPDAQYHEDVPLDQIPSEGIVDGHIPLLTWRSLTMGVFVSMGGFCFGYDTGQISGFLEMEDFLQRYGQLRSDGEYHFSNVRSGLIVALVCADLHLSPYYQICPNTNWQSSP